MANGQMDQFTIEKVNANHRQSSNYLNTCMNCAPSLLLLNWGQLCDFVAVRFNRKLVNMTALCIVIFSYLFTGFELKQFIAKKLRNRLTA